MADPGDKFEVRSLGACDNFEPQISHAVELSHVTILNFKK